MGMFDHVDFIVECPTCGKLVNGFQSKSGNCLLDTVNFSEVDNFYSYCKYCGTWIEYNIKEESKNEPEDLKTIDDYNITVKKNHVDVKGT